MNEIAEVTAPTRNWDRLFPKQDRLVVGWVLAIKVLLLLFGAECFRVCEDRPLPSPLGWLQVWSRWDALHYLKIAESGYTMTGVSKAFYPLYPWSIRLVAFLTGNYLVAAFVVSGLASIAAVILLRRLVALDYPPITATRAVWFFLIFPTAYFLHIDYSESLFLTLAFASILAARSSRWWLAGIVGAFCWMTRPTGIVLIPTLAVEAAHQFWVTRRWNWRWLWIAVVPAGFAVYLLINWRLSGDPLAFLQTRKTLFVQSFAPSWTGIREAIGNLDRHPNQAEMVGRQELLFVALGFVCTIVSWIKLRPVYSMWMTASWILVTSVTFLQSTPRYTLSMFPIFILFALIAKNRFWRGVLTIWSLVFFALFASLYARGWWAF